jgi:hypothetical protein
MATIGEVYEDLLALEVDFEACDFDFRGRWLSVTTEPITLENVYLGPFEIRLDWGRAGSDSAYRVDVELPLELDYGRPFEGSDWELWHNEYVDNVRLPPPDPPKPAKSDRRAESKHGDDALIDDWWRDAWGEYADFERFEEEAQFGYIY